jgi:AAA+ superfamily predicted ATPase
MQKNKSNTETENQNEIFSETEQEDDPQVIKDTKLGPLRGKERMAIVKQIIENYDGDCDRFRKDKQGENNALYYSLDTLKKAKSQYLLNNSDYNWINALTTTASTLQASLKGNVSG